MAAVACTLAAAGIFVGSQPVSMQASADATVSDSAGQEASEQRATEIDSAASRDERPPVAGPLPAPVIPGADVALSPDLGESGLGIGADGTSVLAGTACPTAGFGGVDPHVAAAGFHLITVFGLSESDVGGLAYRPGNPSSDHPRGLALDFMVDSDTGDALAAYAAEHADALGISYIMWQVPAHYDHVHISFRSGAEVGFGC